MASVATLRMHLALLLCIALFVAASGTPSAPCDESSGSCRDSSTDEHSALQTHRARVGDHLLRISVAEADTRLLKRARELALEDLRKGRGGPAETFKNPTEAFSFMDQDGDGLVDVEDILRLEHKVKKMKIVHGLNASDFISVEEVRAQIADVDTDGDGKMSRDEVEANANKTFEKEQHKQGVDAKKLAGLMQSAAVLQMRDERKLALLDIHRDEANLSRGLAGEVHQIAGQAVITALYTYGAPGTANPQLYNMQESDRCFLGDRVYNAGRRPGLFWGYYERSDPIPWTLNILGYRHAKMEALKLKEWDAEDPEKQPATENSEWPGLDSYFWVDAHMTGMYDDHVEAQERWPFAAKMEKFAKYVYYESEKEIAGEVKHLGWRLIGASVSTDEWGATDQVALFQEDGTNDCVLTFKGTDMGTIHDAVSDWLTNFNALSTDFCGFRGVHSGFANEVRRSTSSPEYNREIKPKLPHCQNVYTAGHSLGGAQAELFAACINNHEASSNSDFKNLTWRKSNAMDFAPL